MDYEQFEKERIAKLQDTFLMLSEAHEGLTFEVMAEWIKDAGLVLAHNMDLKTSFNEITGENHQITISGFVQLLEQMFGNNNSVLPDIMWKLIAVKFRQPIIPVTDQTPSDKGDHEIKEKSPETNESNKTDQTPSDKGDDEIKEKSPETNESNKIPPANLMNIIFDEAKKGKKLDSLFKALADEEDKLSLPVLDTWFLNSEIKTIPADELEGIIKRHCIKNTYVTKDAFDKIIRDVSLKSRLTIDEIVQRLSTARLTLKSDAPNHPPSTSEFLTVQRLGEISRNAPIMYACTGGFYVQPTISRRRKYEFDDDNEEQFWKK